MKTTNGLLACVCCRQLHVARDPEGVPLPEFLYCYRCGTPSAAFVAATIDDLDAAGMPPRIYECVIAWTT